MTKILLVDDHSIVRTGLKLLIDSNLEDSVVLEASNGDSAREQIRQNRPDLVVMDVSMPQTDTFGLVGELLELDPSLKIIMFSMNCEELYAKRFLKLGAMGYLNKEAPSHEIKRAINTVLQNKKYISAELSEKLLRQLDSKKKSENPFETLSHREFEIVRFLVQGTSSSEISRNLNLHSSTIATYKARIFEKLKCNNLIELSNLAQIYHIQVAG